MGKDLTSGDPTRLIMLFTLPMLVGNIFQQFYSMADTVIVSQTIGMNALAAVGSTGSITFLILGLAMGLTAGLSVITAQRFGQKDMQGIRRNLAASLMITAGISLILTIVATSLTWQILVWMRTPEEIIQYAYDYLVVIFLGTGASVFFNLMSNILRAIGDSKVPLVFLMIACALNIFLDYLFILGFNTGVKGAAVATILSQFVSAALCLVYIWKKVPFLRIYKEDWKPAMKEIPEHLRLGLPMGFQFSIIAIGSIGLQIALNTLGAAAVAAYTAAQRIDSLAVMPLQSFGTTMATYAAQNYGARKFNRIWEGVRTANRISVGYSLVAGATLVFFGRQLSTIFVNRTDFAVLDMTQQYYLTNSTMYFLLALLYVYRNTLQGLGNSKAPTVAGIMELFARIVGALILSQSFGFFGAVLSNPLAWLGALLPLVYTYVQTRRELSGRVHLLPEQAEEDIPEKRVRKLSIFNRK